MTQKEEIKIHRKQVATTLFDGECFVCKKKYGKNFQFHHLIYWEGGKTYRDFTNGDAYQKYILPIIEGNSVFFRLLCNKHHYTIEQLKKFSVDKQERIFDVVRRSRVG